jgi:periplasmic protein TonB
VAIEAAVLSLLVVGPLLFPGVLPNVLSRTPVPPYHRGLADVFVASAPRAPSSSTNSQHSTFSLLAQQPAQIPNHVPEGPITDAGPAFGPANGDPGVPGGDPNGLRIPGISIHQPPELKSPAEKPAKPLLVSRGVMEAALINQVQPSYPTPARMMRLSGEVVLHAIIGKDGSVRELQPLGGNPILVQAALAAVRQWRYRPTLLNGEPVEVDTTITVKFVLGNE